MDKNKVFRHIPKVDVLFEDEKIQELITIYGRECVLDSVRTESDALRARVVKMDSEEAALADIDGLKEQICRNVKMKFTPHMKRVINGTGTVLHTNLGRAPIAPAQMEQIAKLASAYSNLEYNLEEGRRGERYSHFEQLLCRLTGAEAAMAVNNNAAAVMLILSSLTKGGEAVVSRGELVEIGGKFRIPDVMEQSGTRMIEVGTTNKTHLEDYERAIGDETKALLKVHTSNYKIVGFTENVTIEDLIPLARKHDIPVIEDLGSGVLIDLSKYGITYEPTVQNSIAQGADVVSFSGDKLLGGPQAGIIVGRKEYIDKMKKNQLTRALRIDKFTAAALELTLIEYQSEERAVKNIPTLRMITRPLTEVRADAEHLKGLLTGAGIDADVAVADCESQIGGGSLPLERIKSAGLTIVPHKITTAALEAKLHRLEVPIIPRVINDEVLLDMRTILPADHEEITEILRKVEM